MRYLRAALRLLPALLLAVTLAGCDSGGDNGGGGALSGTLTYEVNGPSGEPIGVSEEFFWTQDGNPDCFANRSTNKSTPVEGEELSVSSVSNCDRDPDDFDGVRVTVTPSNDVDLTVRILSDGDVVEETSETTDLDGFQGYRISIGETFDFGS